MTTTAPSGYSFPQFAAKSVLRAAARAILSGLVTWPSTPSQEDGLTVIIGAAWRLPHVALANLRFLSLQKADCVREVLLVFDCLPGELPADYPQRIAAVAGGLPVRCLFYTPRQVRIARTIDWGWIYSWMSWSLGIGACRTRLAMLHDLDALLLRTDILQERHDRIREHNCTYMGIGYYEGRHVVAADRLAKTFELTFNVNDVRSSVKPVDLFNRMAVIGGRRVEFDTFLHAQRLSGSVRVSPIDETDMVHPSQMICQFVDHVRRPVRVPTVNNLLMLPYYQFLGGDDSLLVSLSADLASSPDGSVKAWGRPLAAGRIGAAHADWLRKQTLRAESAARSGGPPDQRVLRYLDAIDAAVNQAAPAR